MANHPQRKSDEVFIGYHTHSLMRMSVLPEIRQCTETGQDIPLAGGSNGHFSGRLPTFAPIAEIRKLQRRALDAGGTPMDVNVLDPNFNPEA
ncbi:MAG: hypothetical protein AAB447_02890 [Patescibacteria group bacterium]